MKRKYKDHNFTRSSVELIQTINEVLEEYVNDGYTLTLRQLFYQLVSRDIIPNDQKKYSKLSRDLTNARMAGLVDWKSIEDRLRTPKIPYWVDGPRDALDDTITQYRLDRQKDQANYIEVWVEKDALSQVLERVTKEYHIRLMVNRGYSSCSAMRVSAMRFLAKERLKRDCHILYFGDHDPSGLDMIRDIGERLREFGCRSLTVHHEALTMDQIVEYEPYPNPAKESDARARKYIEEHGDSSWELDALEPRVLNQILQDSIERLIDRDKFDKIVEKEERERQSIIDFSESF